ncbi:lipopolysaccharide-induced tumor necrosis factor-alpha factor homolog [Bombyx mandarina]|uniref:LITAF domain-containing protein n=2 Tax=Bombyx TaxID=7090 RepID=A0A8R2APB8_BOMMO|nr:lipopolysaccharide-induced tumor necrosis factor-alpha factor homolog [Bombyx mori]XP_028033895.1 lipopolysaccharide-induced tumor necrosis factor-alpha factor homolog [Bombyx mandarina]
MSTHQGPSAPLDDLPPPYSSVVGTTHYGFVAPALSNPIPDSVGAYPPAKPFTPPGVYPHPEGVTNATVNMQPSRIPPPPPGLPVGIVLPNAMGTEPTTLTCFNCNKIVTTRVTYTTAWHTHLIAGSICLITIVCSLCCLGLIPYCFDTFKEAEHYCPNCNTFIGKSNKC